MSTVKLITVIHRLKLQINKNTYYIMRDDLLPISFGGNKARKAVLFFEDLTRKGYDCVVTYGSSSSNHCRIVTNMAASLNIPCHLIVPIEASKPTANSKMIQLFNVQIVHCSASEARGAINCRMEELRRSRKKPYFIPGGGHGNLGTQAYADAYEEILAYENSAGLNFDYIFHASGTGTTQAGLVCGKIKHNDNKRIVGISIARKNPYGGEVVLNSVNDYLKSIGRDTVNSDYINFVDEYTLDGYGSYNDSILDTIREVLIRDGIPLDTIYTAKAFWGMKEYIRDNKITGKNILFIHTGGTPLFFDDLERLTHE